MTFNPISVIGTDDTTRLLSVFNTKVAAEFAALEARIDALEADTAALEARVLALEPQLVSGKMELGAIEISGTVTVT